MRNEERAVLLVKEHLAERGVSVESGDVLLVWYCKTLKNWKALVTTTLGDGVHYEITHNGSAADGEGETYIDVYKKLANICVPS